LLINRRIEGFHCIYASHASLKNLAGHMQVNKSNENYYLSYDAVIVADDRSSSVKSYDWRSSTSSTNKTLLLRWLAQASNLHRGKGYI
jgi:hypothetical protein